jgi:hypothetical protein
MTRMNETTSTSSGIRIRLLAALLALVAGATAAIIAILVIRSVLG